MLSEYFVIRMHPKLRIVYNEIKLWMFCRKDNVKGFVIQEHISKKWSFSNKIFANLWIVKKNRRKMNILCHAGRFGREYFVYETTNYKANYEWNIKNNSCGVSAHNSVQNILPNSLLRTRRLQRNTSTNWSADESGTWSHTLNKQ